MSYSLDVLILYTLEAYPISFFSRLICNTVTTAHESSGSPGNIRNIRNNGGTSGIKHYTKKVDGVTANVIEIAPGTAVPTVVLAQDRIGGTEELASMASRSGAKVAINGTFFEAYDGVPEPWGTLIKNG